MKSLQGRLNLGLASTLMVFMFLFWWISLTSLNHIANELVSSRLEHDGEALLAALKQDPKGEWEIRDSQVGHIYQRVFSGHYYVVTMGEQRLRSRSLWDFELPDNQANEQIGPEQQQLLVWQSNFSINKQTVHILVAEDMTPLNASLTQYSQVYAFVCLLLLGLLLLVQHILIRSSFCSLGKVGQELEALASGEINQLSLSVPQEIKPLVDEVNNLLQQLTQRLLRSRNAMGNLAHSLKHPLNLLMQLAQQQELSQNTQVELNKYTQQIQQLMERELKRARLAGGGLPGQQFNAEEELPALIDVLKRIYQHKKLDFQYQIDQASLIPADRNDMLELLGNLLDNACKWAKTKVVCQISYQQQLTITIEDDGEGCSNEEISQLTERGVRLDETVDGSGLGLAIVKEIVLLYQGALRFERGEMGGLRVEVKV